MLNPSAGANLARSFHQRANCRQDERALGQKQYRNPLGGAQKCVGKVSYRPVASIEFRARQPGTDKESLRSDANHLPSRRRKKRSMYPGPTRPHSCDKSSSLGGAASASLSAVDCHAYPVGCHTRQDNALNGFQTHSIVGDC